MEIVKPVETVEVVIDPDAAGEEGALVEDGQLIAVERSGLSDEASEQVTRWAAALEGYRKEQVRLGIPYGEKEERGTRVGRAEVAVGVRGSSPSLSLQIPSSGQLTR